MRRTHLSRGGEERVPVGQLLHAGVEPFAHVQLHTRASAGRVSRVTRPAAARPAQPATDGVAVRAVVVQQHKAVEGISVMRQKELKDVCSEQTNI